MRFVGLSNVAHVVRNLGLGTDATLSDVRTKADDVCGSGPTKKAERDKLFKTIDPKFGGYVCFDAFYVIQVVNYGWGAPREHVRHPDSRWGDEPSWPLGAMIFEAAKSTSAAGR